MNPSPITLPSPSLFSRDYGVICMHTRSEVNNHCNDYILRDTFASVYEPAFFDFPFDFSIPWLEI